ncbi:MAG: hypothetical protein HN742_24210 [Lentisphaerae bacterium]|nr:hypothetical protein [Lentisphaerota bacterium]MBT4820722.1 hypothetical protein [Lentisphaerota bacterium]MBT5604360.1 hypothetical protein [Lentisphaerota bacterium]MBT7065661.1 hypothetical protein [Verrucomicrobiota bacterium]MBT7845003.1 hypothetical protein [Lentisphaerota bacterium]
MHADLLPVPIQRSGHIVRRSAEQHGPTPYNLAAGLALRKESECSAEGTRKWETILDQAAKRGLYVIPVFATWAKWNDGSDGKRWHYWDGNWYDACGAAISHEKEVIARFRDTECFGPDWPTRRLDDQRVMLFVPGRAQGWRPAVHNPVSLRLGTKDVLNRKSSALHVRLPVSKDAVVLRLTADETMP